MIYIYISFKIQHQVAYKTNHIYIYIFNSLSLSNVYPVSKGIENH